MAVYNFEDKIPKQKKADYQKIVGCILVAFSIFCLFCLITHFVPFIKSFLLGIAGLFCYPFFITLMAVGFALVGHKRYIMPKKYGIFLSLSIICVLSIIQLILIQNSGLSFWQFLAVSYTKKLTAGGILLSCVVAPVLYVLNRLGAYIVFIALSLVFIALTVDYIHYLSKNENLKNAIKISQEATEPIQKQTVTVRELENNLKKSHAVSNQAEHKSTEKVKITLDATQHLETAEESAKRKLGLLASSKQDEEDNSRYFKQTPKSEQKAYASTKEYLLSGYNETELSSYRNKQLDKIQKQISSLKEKTTPQKSIIPVSENNYSPVLPNKVIHDNLGPVYSPDQLNNKIKSRMGEVESNSNEVLLPKLNIVDNTVCSNDTESENISNNKETNSNGFDKNNMLEDNLNINQNISQTLNVDDFANSVLKNLNSSNTASYKSPNTMFEEEPTIIEPIKPKPIINYVKPPIELLTTESMDLSLVSQDVVMKREELEIALDTFGIPAKVIGVVIGPAVTRYELEMPAGVSIKRLLALQEDIAYNLSSNGDIRIEAPIPGRRAVGIEVPNERIATVGLRDIIMSPEFMESKSNLSIALGKDISGAVKTFSLIKIPHLLIAGTTGSGKSVCINAIILSLIYRYSPDEVKFILIDPKRVEFSMYNNLPHLLMPNVITDSEKALNALSWCVDEMERRFIVFSNARVKNLEEYNASEEVLEGRAEKLPYIIFIIDELADLLMTSKKEAEDYICRILQKARAAGIHMILATQRPSVDIVTGKIKANLSARICFALMTFADSKTVLDQAGADKLLGKGDMLFLSSDTGVPKRIQGCFVTTKEIDDVVNFVKENNGDYEFDIKTEQSILNPAKKDVVSQVDGDRASNDGFDALMPQVLKLVIDNGHASISMIQRKFLVGFPRAARIIDQMEQAGYISPSDGGTKVRSVYITKEEYDKLYGEG